MMTFTGSIVAVLKVTKTVFLSHLYMKTNILPRQARDKHRESTQKGPFFAVPKLTDAWVKTHYKKTGVEIHPTGIAVFSGGAHGLTAEDALGAPNEKGRQNRYLLRSIRISVKTAETSAIRAARK